ncbi:uncharacterized protein LOC106012436, partial [Aplysia californica]|uniref:Uncharacterized protein LOC106012436 n=1 Tax=Aplysia californica TaxID=6500 RepID=A0ABM1A4V3_APLCA
MAMVIRLTVCLAILAMAYGHLEDDAVATTSEGSYEEDRFETSEESNYAQNLIDDYFGSEESYEESYEGDNYETNDGYGEGTDLYDVMQKDVGYTDDTEQAYNDQPAEGAEWVSPYDVQGQQPQPGGRTGGFGTPVFVRPNKPRRRPA